MTPSQPHNERKVKNYLLLGLMLLVVVTIFAITIVKLRFVDEEAAKPASAVEGSSEKEGGSQNSVSIKKDGATTGLNNEGK